MTVKEIDDVIRRFGKAARSAQKAGFTGVQIHAGHGYLIRQFLSPHHNQRTDKWGGSAENRRRFLMEIYAEIRRRVGSDFTVAIKLNSADFHRGGVTEEESLATVKALAAAGIDLVEVSGGTYEAPAMSGALEETKKASTLEREAYFLDFAAKARAAVADVPLMVTGGFRAVRGMNAALASGALDVVGVVRLLAIEPDAATALLAGRDPTERVKPIRTGIQKIDKLGIMEVFWYNAPLKRIAKGGNPRPREGGMASLMRAVLTSGWGPFRSRRARA